MLETTKAITLTGKSTVNNQVVANFTANVYNDDAGSDSFNTFIANKELYDANKKVVRKDSQDFQNLMYEAQDEIADSTKDTEKTE
ncbi:hypothetical protein H5S09_02600 [Limosilactobacillus sp. STM2_1]|uniref:Uncharacterized protein n=1 Tax=Limosilactobacillus rudii TaxID=2759755 RepID=A0A7W3YMT3_9LACO|nr:hypothetical protein [Limosilactobacillus rudii]MBB1080255.1 hypothetical protein [Limosilactobacillus rudii]MBB1096841.1 hypothetical protein [Limosilactobacillus rudii]MCD7133738.1 hypothetical protein [Limosilactobacillus rudii]